MTHKLCASARRLALIGLLVLGAAGPAVAVQQPQDPGAEVPALAPGEVQRLLDAYAVMQAQEFLGLSEAQFPQFVSRLRVIQDTRRRNEQTRNQLLQQIARLTNPTSGQARDEDIRERLKSFRELESRSVTELLKAYENLDQVLDVRQQARFRVFEEQMERRKLELLMRARAVGRPPRPQRPLARPQ